MEKQAHEVTRSQYRDDLRLWAGISDASVIRLPAPPGAAEKG
jgi:hypothetical protein